MGRSPPNGKTHLEDLLTQSGVRGNERASGPPLKRMLVQAGGNTRGPKPFNGSVADWAAINFDYVVVR